MPFEITIRDGNVSLIVTPKLVINRASRFYNTHLGY